MTPDPSASRADAAAGGVVLSIDAMGGDHGPAAVVAGCAESADKNADVRFILHGPGAELEKLIGRRSRLSTVCEIRDAPGVVRMDDKPSQVARKGEGTSMWSAVESVRRHEAECAVSCGNTGALMALSMLRLRRLPGVNRPAIACLWPSTGRTEFNVMLDVGADIRADAPDLVQYAVMGASYAQSGLGIVRPRVGLLNVGTEEHKGRAELKQAHDLMAAASNVAGFDYIGFVEGSDLPSARVDVIVTDGFTGNIALKTAEGTAKLVGQLLREAFDKSIMSKFAAVLAMASLKRLQTRIDPRRVNGGVFLGLNGTVVKSHGSADATGIAAAIKLACLLARSGFQDGLSSRMNAVAALRPSATDGTPLSGAAS